MFDYSYKINLYKSKINPSNYLEILGESLNHVVSIDLINDSIKYLIDDCNITLIDKFLLLCLNNLKTNIKFEAIFVKSNYQEILKIPISYTVYSKFVSILQIIKTQITIRNESFYNFVLYMKFGPYKNLDLFFDVSRFSDIDLSVYKDLLEELYSYNSHNKLFIDHARELNICINKNKNCINEVKLRDILICINTNPLDEHYKALKRFDFEKNTQNQELLISFVKSQLQKDIYSLKKVIEIFKNITITKRLLFSYFVYIYHTYTKYSNNYIKDLMMNIASNINFETILDMIIEFYIENTLFCEDLDLYFAPLKNFINFDYCTHMHEIYPLLYAKQNVVIEKYDCYLKAYYILNEEEDKADIADYKVIALCLLSGYFNLSKYKLYIKNNIINILAVMRQEYMNKNTKTCIFTILGYLKNELAIRISKNIFEYWKTLGCIVCQDNCLTGYNVNNRDVLDYRNKNAYQAFIDLLGNSSDVEIIVKNFIHKYETDCEFKERILNIYSQLPSSIVDVIGHIKQKPNVVLREKPCLCVYPAEYIREKYVDDLRITDIKLYNEAIEVLFCNAKSTIKTRNVLIADIKSAKDYRTFLTNLNDFLINSLEENKLENLEILKYTEIFNSKLLEFSVVNLLNLTDKNEITNTFDEILADKINNKILRFIIFCDYTFNLQLNKDNIIEACQKINDYYYLIYILEARLVNDKNDHLYNLLQQSYYKIKDHDRVEGVSSMFVRPTKENLFYEYKIGKENENVDNDIIAQFKIIEDDLMEWKNIKNKDTLSRHFIMDCQLVDKNINNLDLVTKRRQISHDKCLFYLHDILYNGLCSQIAKANTSNLQDENLDKIHSFYVQTKRDYICHLITNKKFDQAIDLVYSLLETKEWSFYFELGEIYFLMKNKSNAKKCYKKILDIFDTKDQIYLKTLLRYLELVNSESLYAKNINYLNNVSRVWMLYGKITNKIDHYINSLLIEDEYKYECVPRIFHILGQTSERKNLTKSYKTISLLLENRDHKKMLIPFFSQILCKINNNLVSKFINKVVISLMSDFQEVFWPSIYFINDITTDELPIDSKIYLNKMKQMVNVLYNVSKAPNIVSLKNEFPEIHICIGMLVPNKYPVIIKDVENDVLIYKSLQAPKRLCFIGDDGKKYYYLCKYKDDLRKDCRFLELCKLISKLFSNNNDYYKYSLQKSLYIRLYEVIPCYYNFGLIEYIEELTSLKTICYQYHCEIGRSIKEYLSKKKIGVKNFSAFLNAFEPIMDKHIRSMFLEPFDWYTARNNFVKTCGVISIVGWFMGLGDRHTENILLDTKNFDIIHVDLNCIFDKGKKCSIPELVPFRLTQNIVDGFGILGVNGTYTQTCILTLDLLQKNRSIIISNLLSFVHDPLHEWNQKEDTGKTIIETLDMKIQNNDVISKVEELIEAATNHSNLANMYIGWLSFL